MTNTPQITEEMKSAIEAEAKRAIYAARNQNDGVVAEVAHALQNKILDIITPPQKTEGDKVEPELRKIWVYALVTKAPCSALEAGGT